MIGSTVSHYRITGTLGVGGMGVVYEAEDTRLARTVALKFLTEGLADDPDAARRLQREAQTVAALNHPNICTVYEIDQEKSALFIVMEHVDGPNLKLHMAAHAMTDAELVSIAQQITAALDAAHTAGIVHRDIKPGNIVVSATGQVKVLDFGLARRFTLPGSGELIPGGSTMPGRPLGTMNYMAPERILQMPLDPRCDLFSLGVVIYEMASGKLPFSGASPSKTVMNILEKEPVPLTKAAPDRPPGLGPIVGRLLAKRADERYQSAAEVGVDLKALKLGRRTRKRFG